MTPDKFVATPAWQHAQALRVVVANSAYEDGHIAAEVCRAFIASSVPVSDEPGSAIRYFVAKGGSWSQNPDIVQLFGEYLRAGYLGVNELVGPCPGGLVERCPAGCLPLEAAIWNECESAIEVLIKHGADEHLVPSAAARAGLGDSPVSGLVEFIWAALGNDAPRLVSFTVEALMRRRLASVSARPITESAGRRRLGV
jgi:hypothetical protein